VNIQEVLDQTPEVQRLLALRGNPAPDGDFALYWKSNLRQPDCIEARYTTQEQAEADLALVRLDGFDSAKLYSVRKLRRGKWCRL